jgi:hypothetical protein
MIIDWQSAVLATRCRYRSSLSRKVFSAAAGAAWAGVRPTLAQRVGWIDHRGGCQRSPGIGEADPAAWDKIDALRFVAEHCQHVGGAHSRGRGGNRPTVSGASVVVQKAVETQNG